MLDLYCSLEQRHESFRFVKVCGSEAQNRRVKTLLRLNLCRLVAACRVQMANELVALVAVEPHLPRLAIHHFLCGHATALRQRAKLVVILAV